MLKVLQLKDAVDSEMGLLEHGGFCCSMMLEDLLGAIWSLE